MADEQGVTTNTDNDLADGQFSRAVTGKAVKGDISVIEALLVNVGPDGRQFPERTSPPSNPTYGDVYLADGTTWDPDGDGVAGGELVIYNSSGGWTEIVGGL